MTIAKGDQRQFVQVSRVNPRYFQLADGTPFVPVACNICFPRFVDPKDEAQGLALMRRLLTQFASNGGNVFRFYLAHQFFDIEHEKAGQYDMARFQRILAVLDHARSLNLRVKLTIDHFRSIMPAGQIEQFPGAARFDKPVYHRANGGPAESMDDYFQSRTGRDHYLKKIDFYARHLADDPVIFGWELWNEVNAVKSDAWADWTQAMLSPVAQRLPKHLVMQTLGGLEYQGLYSHYDRVPVMPDNAVAQIHRYLNLGGDMAVAHGPMDLLAYDATKFLAMRAADKPVLLNEVGAVEAHHAAPFKAYAQDTHGIILHDSIFAPFFAQSAGSGHPWHWQLYIDKNHLWWHFNRFAELIRDVNPLLEDFRPSMSDSGLMRTYRLTGKKTVLIWQRDAMTDWRHELLDGQLPRHHDQQTLVLTADELAASSHARTLDLWSSDSPWQPAHIADGQVALPPFSRSIALKLTRP